MRALGQAHFIEKQNPAGTTMTAHQAGALQQVRKALSRTCARNNSLPEPHDSTLGPGTPARSREHSIKDKQKQNPAGATMTAQQARALQQVRTSTLSHVRSKLLPAGATMTAP